MKPITRLLKDEVVTLEPFKIEDDPLYLMDLVSKDRYNMVPPSMALELFKKYSVHLWKGYYNRAGKKTLFCMVFLCYVAVQKRWYLDAYRDDSAVDKGSTDLSYRAGRMVLDWFFLNYRTDIFTSHSIKNVAATKICEKLGFVPKDVISTAVFGNLVSMELKF